MSSISSLRAIYHIYIIQRPLLAKIPGKPEALQKNNSHQYLSSTRLHLPTLHPLSLWEEKEEKEEVPYPPTRRQAPKPNLPPSD